MTKKIEKAMKFRFEKELAQIDTELMRIYSKLYSSDQRDLAVEIESMFLSLKDILYKQKIEAEKTQEVVDIHYQGLHSVLSEAYAQAASGKGKERHAVESQRFEDQPILTISRMLASGDGLAFQAIKKIHEAKRLDKDGAKKELLGAIVYIAGLILYLEEQ